MEKSYNSSSMKHLSCDHKYITSIQSCPKSNMESPQPVQEDMGIKNEMDSRFDKIMKSWDLEKSLIDYNVKQKEAVCRMIDENLPYTIRQAGKTRVHFYTRTENNRKLTKLTQEDIVNEINQDLNQFEDVRRGDIAMVIQRFDIDPYIENFIFDGVKFINFSDEHFYDMDTSIKSQFNIPDQFPIYYWNNILTDARVPFDYTKWSDQLAENYTITEFNIPDQWVKYSNGHTKYQLFYSWFLHNNEKYYIFAYNFEKQLRYSVDKVLTLDKSTFLNAIEKESHLFYHLKILDAILPDKKQMMDLILHVLNTDRDHLLYFFFD